MFKFTLYDIFGIHDSILSLFALTSIGLSLVSLIMYYLQTGFKTSLQTESSILKYNSDIKEMRRLLEKSNITEDRLHNLQYDLEKIKNEVSNLETQSDELTE